AVHCRHIETVREQFHILVPLLLAAQVVRKTSDRLISYCVKAVENDAEISLESLLVISLKFRLWRRQLWANRIVNKIQRQQATIADRIKFSEGRDAFVEDTVAALPVDVFG